MRAASRAPPRARPAPRRRGADPPAGAPVADHCRPATGPARVIGIEEAVFVRITPLELGVADRRERDAAALPRRAPLRRVPEDGEDPRLQARALFERAEEAEHGDPFVLDDLLRDRSVADIRERKPQHPRPVLVDELRRRPLVSCRKLSDERRVPLGQDCGSALCCPFHHRPPAIQPTSRRRRNERRPGGIQRCDDDDQGGSHERRLS